MNCSYVFFKNGAKIGEFRKTWENACVSVGIEGNYSMILEGRL